MELKKYRCYLVKVKTTNHTGNTSKKFFNNTKFNFSHYFDCENGYIYVMTDNPSKIYNEFSPETIISIKDVGVGYVL